MRAMALLHKLREVVFQLADRSEVAWQPTFALANSANPPRPHVLA